MHWRLVAALVAGALACTAAPPRGVAPKGVLDYFKVLIQMHTCTSRLLVVTSPCGSAWGPTM